MRCAIRRTSAALMLAVALAPACQTPDKAELLERVARDWCLTIRASQVLPVYPLTEDLQPGDVFVVQTPLSKQQKEYTTRGFLPLDQLLVRLPVDRKEAPTDPKQAAARTDDGRLPYGEFYRAAFFKEAYGKPSARPMKKEDPVPLPRAAFPTYNFSYQEGSGLQLALPIQGVPVGLGLMGASRATGSVTITDAYTYGIDIESLYRSLIDWWSGDPYIRETLTAVVQRTRGDVYLRSVNRVYLTRGVAVSLQGVDSFSARADVGAPQKLSLPDLSSTNPASMKASAAAYQEALEALSAPSNAVSPGGAFHFTQASQNSVAMNETFDRPLVIGYLGFDVRVEKNGSLSPPIPSFSLLNERVQGFGALDQLEDLVEVGQPSDAQYIEAARLLGGEFQASFEAARGNRSPELAFLKAKNDFLNVEDPAEAESRTQAINDALLRASKED